MTKHKTAHPRGATRRASGGAATPTTTSDEVLMKQPDRTPFPKIVSQAQWQAAHERLLAKEKAATRARDKLAAERRRQPMTRIEKDYVFTGPKGPARLRDLFEGRRQLVLYHFMFAPGVSGWPQAGCDRCSMFVDQIGHPAPLAISEAYRKRMGWTLPWYSSADNDFNVDFGRTTPEGEPFGLSVFLRDGDDVYRSYFTEGRLVEPLGSVWTFLDLTPYGRQEEW